MRRRLKRYLAAFTAVLVAIVWAFPVYWMINSSFLSPLTISQLTPTFLPFGGTFRNYREVTSETNFFEALRMSLMVVAATLVVCIAFATLAAFAISRFRFRGRRSFVLTVILVQMLPAEAMFIAQYKMIGGLRADPIKYRTAGRQGRTGIRAPRRSPVCSRAPRRRRGAERGGRGYKRWRRSLPSGG